MKNENKPIIFEGPDSVGKTTLVRHVAECISNAGVSVQSFSFPGSKKGTLGYHIHRLHHSPPSVGIDRLTPASLQTLHVAAHLDIVEREIIPALERGRLVILDRYWWSTWVYGKVSGVNPKALRLLIQLEMEWWNDVVPAMAFLIRRSQPTDAVGRAIVAEYEALADCERQRYRVQAINNDRPIAEIASEILNIVLEVKNMGSRQ